MSAFRATGLTGWVLAALFALSTGLFLYVGAVAADSGPMLRIKPAKHDFGQVIVTKASAPLTVTVTNKSRSAPVTFTSIVAAETFSIISDKCSGSPLAPGSSCKIQIAFRPIIVGKLNDPNALTFTDSASNSPQHVELDGQGIVGSFL